MGAAQTHFKVQKHYLAENNDERLNATFIIIIIIILTTTTIIIITLIITIIKIKTIITVTIIKKISTPNCYSLCPLRPASSFLLQNFPALFRLHFALPSSRRPHGWHCKANSGRRYRCQFLVKEKM